MALTSYSGLIFCFEDTRRQGGFCSPYITASAYFLAAKENVTHIACGFDHVIESFRNELLNTYKNSLGVPGNLMAQFDVAERAVRSLGVTVWPMVEFEADYAIAAAVHMWTCHPAIDQIGFVSLTRISLNWRAEIMLYAMTGATMQ